MSVIGVHLHGSDIGTAREDLPVSRETLDKSVTELIPSHAPFPDAADGIRRWRKASGGVFTISVAEILTVVERTMQDSAGQPSKRKPRE